MVLSRRVLVSHLCLLLLLQETQQVLKDFSTDFWRPHTPSTLTELVDVTVEQLLDMQIEKLDLSMCQNLKVSMVLAMD